MLNPIHTYTHVNKKSNLIWLFNLVKKINLNFFFFINIKKYKNFLNISLNLVLVLLFNFLLLPLNLKLFKLQFVIYIIALILVLTLFNYFRTIYTFSKWTTQIKFFWLRVFTIFWGLEFYLLAIFFFLFIISPDEFKYFFFITKVIFEAVPNNITIESYLTILLLLLIVSSMVYSIVYKSTLRNYLSLVVFLFLIMYILLIEVESYLNYAVVSNYKTNINETIKTKLLNLTTNSTEYKILTNYCQLSSLNTENILKQRPSTFILNIILIVKFYHVYTILILTLCLLIVNVWTNSTKSVEVCAFLTQNLIIMLLFYSLNYFIYYKFLYKYIIYGFYNNITLSYTTGAEISYVLEFFQNELLFNFIL